MRKIVRYNRTIGATLCHSYVGGNLLPLVIAIGFIMDLRIMTFPYVPLHSKSKLVPFRSQTSTLRTNCESLR